MHFDLHKAWHSVWGLIKKGCPEVIVAISFFLYFMNFEYVNSL